MLKRLRSLLGAPQAEPPPRGPVTPAPEEVTDATFAERALSAGPLTLVDFWAEWCSPCQVVAAHAEMLAREFGPGLRVLSMDVDENPLTAERYQVMGLPTLLFLRDGVEIERITGAGPFERLHRRVSALLDDAPAA